MSSSSSLVTKYCKHIERIFMLFLLKFTDIHSYFVLEIGSLKTLFVIDLGGKEERICWKLKYFIDDLHYLFCNGLWRAH